MAAAAIRPLTAENLSPLATFTCQTFGQPHTADVQRMVREELPLAVETGMVQAEGGWLGSKLVAVQAWRVDRDPIVVANYGERVWLNVILAVNQGCRREGYGQQLKEHLISLAEAAQMVAITSYVSWANTPMIELNVKLGASVYQIPTDSGPDPDVCRCVIPVR